MNNLRESLREYIDLRRGLGYKMHDEGLMLPRFVSFMEAHHAEHISARLALEWAQCAAVQPAERARRLCFVRGFARYRSATDNLTEIPPPGLLPYRSTHAKAHLYTDDEIRRLLDAALELPVAWRLFNSRSAHCSASVNCGDSPYFVTCRRWQAMRLNFGSASSQSSLSVYQLIRKSK